MSQYPTEINECNVVTITPMGVQCVVVHPSTSVASDGAASLIITGGTPPYSVVWNINGNNVLGLNQINLSVGEYPATVVDYYGDYSASTICVLTGETDCSFEISVDYPDPPIEEEGFYFYDVQITGGTSVGPYTIYYTTISSTTIAELYPSGVAQNLTLSQLQSGVTIKIPENNSLVIVYNQLCDTTRTKFIAPIVRCIELCLTYSGGKTIQFLCDDLDENGVQTWVADGMGTCGGSILRWDLPNNRWIIEGCVIEDGELFSNDPVTSNPPLNWNVVGSQYPISVFGTEGFCSLSNPLVLNVSVNQPDCEPDGSIILSAQGGFSPYLFSINDGLTAQSSPIFNNLGPGTYSCQVIDSSGNTENSVVVLNSLLPNETYELQLQTTTQVIQNTTQVSNIGYTTNLVVTPPIPNGVTITFDFTHLGVFKNSRKPGFSSLNRTIVLNKNGSPISVTTTNSSTYLESVQPQCDEGGDTVQVTASTNEWNSISITQGDTIQILTSSVITYSTPPNVCDFGIDNNEFTLSNPNIQGCSCCDVEITSSPVTSIGLVYVYESCEPISPLTEPTHIIQTQQVPGLFIQNPLSAPQTLQIGNSFKDGEGNCWYYVGVFDSTYTPPNSVNVINVQGNYFNGFSTTLYLNCLDCNTPPVFWYNYGGTTNGYNNPNNACIDVGVNGSTQTYYSNDNTITLGSIIYLNVGTFFNPIYQPFIGGNLFYAVGNAFLNTYSSVQINNSGEVVSIGTLFCTPPIP
jgi:hypothetical protein